MENHTSERIYRRFTSVNAIAVTFYISIPGGSLRGDAPGSNLAQGADYYNLIMVYARQMTTQFTKIHNE
jgi:hypothetical protein